MLRVLIYNAMMKKLNRPMIILAGILLLILIIISNFIFSISQKNIINNPIINYGYGWKNNQSNYSGSELDFVFNKSKSISFEFATNSKAEQGVEIFVDRTPYILSSPNLENQKLTIKVDKNKEHSVTIRHFCTRFEYPCGIEVRKILVDRPSQLWSYKWHNKVLSILGDSLSTIYGKDNYSQILSDELGYELHDASVVKSSITNVSGVDNAIKRYKKDLMNFQSDAIIIFSGTNDAGNNVPIDKFQSDYDKIVSDVKKNNPNAKIILVSTLPRKDLSEDVLRPYDSAIETVSKKYKTYFVDPGNWLTEGDFSDDIHPSIEAQSKIANSFKSALSKILE